MPGKNAHKLPPEELVELQPLADIARGGMGKVQLARVVSGRLAGKHVAVKRLNPEHEKDPAFVDMFLDETWMTSAIKSPNVIGVEAWGRDRQGMYLAIELVQGVSLSRLIKESRAQKEPFAERTVACVVSQICAGLDAAHELKGDAGEPLNLVHRDLTPGNVLVSFDGQVKIADFGIAKANRRLTETSAGVMKGKPAYMAPEQARGMELDRRADLFSVGVIMYELLAGKRPWVGNDDLETLIAMATTEPIDLAEIRKTHDVFLDVVRRCLHKDRDKRFASAREIKERLDAWRAEKGFLADDTESLSHFVKRNTPQQIAWFERATAGGLAQGGSTFKEVEEKLDRDRGIRQTHDPRAHGPLSGQGAPTRPAAGAPPNRPLPAPVGPPIAIGAPVATAPAAPPSPREAEAAKVDDLAATRLYDPGPSSSNRTPGPASPRVPGLSGTIAMNGAFPVGQRPVPPGPPSPRQPARSTGPGELPRPPRDVSNLPLPPRAEHYAPPTPSSWPGHAARPGAASGPMMSSPVTSPIPVTQSSPGMPAPVFPQQHASVPITQPSPGMPGPASYPQPSSGPVPPPSSGLTTPSLSPLNEPTSMGQVLVVRKKRNTAAIAIIVGLALLLAAAAAAYVFRSHLPFLSAGAHLP